MNKHNKLIVIFGSFAAIELPLYLPRYPEEGPVGIRDKPDKDMKEQVKQGERQ